MISNRCARKSLVTNCNSIISKNYLRFLVDSNDSKNEFTFYYPKSNRGTVGYLSYLFLDNSNNKLDRSYLARHYYRRIASIWIKSIIV